MTLFIIKKYDPFITIDELESFNKTLEICNNLLDAKDKLKEIAKNYTIYRNHGNLDAAIFCNSLDEFKKKSEPISEGFIRRINFLENSFSIDIYQKKKIVNYFSTSFSFDLDSIFFIESFIPNSYSSWILNPPLVSFSPSILIEPSPVLVPVSVPLPKLNLIKNSKPDFDSVILELKEKFNKKNTIEKKKRIPKKECIFTD